MKRCVLCSKETEGSTGAAGIFWPNICQPCKDIEDGILAKRILAQKQSVDSLLELFGKSEVSK